MRLLILLFLSLPITLLSQAPYAEKRFELLLSESKVQWYGNNFGGVCCGHDGTIQVTSGYLITVGILITKGDFVLDMNTIRNTDQKDAQSRKDLEDHLKSKDFFETDNFPKAFFSITRTTELHDPLQPNQYIVTGFLGIKGITNTITFPATINFTKTTAKAAAVITIDRTKWDVTFQSKTIFSTLKEGALADEIKMTLDLTFKTK